MLLNTYPLPLVCWKLIHWSHRLFGNSKQNDYNRNIFKNFTHWITTGYFLREMTQRWLLFHIVISCETIYIAMFLNSNHWAEFASSIINIHNFQQNYIIILCMLNKTKLIRVLKSNINLSKLFVFGRLVNLEYLQS